MPALKVKFPRGNTAAISSYVGPEGTIAINTETKMIHLQDGVTPGGIVIARLSDTIDIGDVETSIDNALSTHSASGDHDSRYYRKDQFSFSNGILTITP